MNEEIPPPSLKATEGAAKTHCFLCAMARYLVFFILGVFAGLIWGSW